MNIEYLREFAALAENGNYLETAEELYMSQSTLSKHIMKMEKELGTRLFERTTRRVKMTEAGKLLLPYAIKIAGLQDEYSAKLGAHLRDRDNEIILASTSQITQYPIIDQIAWFKRSHMDIRLKVSIHTHEELNSLLLGRRTGFAWIGETDIEAADDRFERIHFMDDPLVLVCLPGHPLAGRTIIAPQDVDGRELIIQDSSSVDIYVFRLYCERKGIFPSLVEIPGGRAIIDFMEINDSAAVMVKSVAEKFAGQGICIIPFEDSPIMHVNTIYAKGRPLSGADRIFIDFLKETARSYGK